MGSCPSCAWYFNNPSSYQETRCLKCYHHMLWYMRRKGNALLMFTLLVSALCIPLLSTASARSVHETATYDLFPQGDLTDESQWVVGATTSFTTQPASYTDSMVADQRMTMVHERPQHTDTLSYWGLTSPSESENVIGSPDGLFMWSTGPVMSVQSFDVSSSCLLYTSPSPRDRG